MTSIFSTYSTGENRVTASFLAVLRSLSLDRIQRLLGALLEQSEFELVRFENQPSKGGSGVPDAIIQSSIRLLIETKTERNGVNVIFYCGMGLLKLAVLVCFFMPWLAIKLVLKKGEV